MGEIPLCDPGKRRGFSRLVFTLDYRGGALEDVRESGAKLQTCGIVERLLPSTPCSSGRACRVSTGFNLRKATFRFIWASETVMGALLGAYGACSRKSKHSSNRDGNQSMAHCTTIHILA
jgi:hypothetical protein